jgi:hypothetical protein
MGGSAYHNRRQSQPIAAAMTTSFVLAAVSPNPQFLSPAKEPLADCNISTFNYQVMLQMLIVYRESIIKTS